MKRIEFVCPRCGEENSLEEINSAYVWYRLCNIEKYDDGSVETEAEREVEPFIDIKERIRYECCQCGYRPSVGTEEDLYDWLEARGMIKDYEMP